MEIYSNKSNKSERNISYKNRNVSYKSVSEISEFDECNEEEPPSEFVTKKAPTSQKLNESIHSDVVSNYSNIEEKDEDKN
jgi:hypothetical protein